VFVRPSRSEGLGNSFLEAMAVGVPVVGAHVGGVSDFLFDPSTHGKKATGLVCNPDDPKNISECIERILTDQQLRECHFKCTEVYS